jgi:hypothetical protein
VHAHRPLSSRFTGPQVADSPSGCRALPVVAHGRGEDACLVMEYIEGTSLAQTIGLHRDDSPNPGSSGPLRDHSHHITNIASDRRPGPEVRRKSVFQLKPVPDPSARSAATGPPQARSLGARGVGPGTQGPGRDRCRHEARRAPHGDIYAAPGYLPAPRDDREADSRRGFRSELRPLIICQHIRPCAEQRVASLREGREQRVRQGGRILVVSALQQLADGVGPQR